MFFKLFQDREIPNGSSHSTNWRFSFTTTKIKIMYEKYGALGMKGWWVDSDAIAAGSV